MKRSRFGIRMLAAIGAAALLAGASGCKPDSSAPAASQGEKDEFDLAAEQLAAAVEKPEEINGGEPVTIRVHLNSLMPSLNAEPTAEQPDVFNSTRIIEKAFKILHPNVTIEWQRNVDTSSAENLLQYLTTQLRSNTAPDLLFAWGSSLSNEGWYYDFTDAMNQPNPYLKDNAKWRDQFPDYVFNSWQVSDCNNRIVSVPMTLAPGTSTALYVNKAIVEETGVELPRTWEELFTATETIRDKGYIGFAPWGEAGSGNRLVTIKVWDIQFSLAPFFMEKVKERFDYNGDGAQDQNEKMRAAYEGRYLLTENEYAREIYRQVKRKYTDCMEPGYENTDYNSKWIVGKLAFQEDGLWRYPKEMSKTNRKFEFDIIPPVAVSTDTTDLVNELQYTEKGPSRPAVSESFNILLPSAEAHGGEPVIEACTRLLQFMSVPEVNELFITELAGAGISFLAGSKVPQQLTAYFEKSFPITPPYEWYSGYNNASVERLSKILELWVKGSLSDEEFYSQFDAEMKKDIEEYVAMMQVDTTGWTKGW